MGDSFYQEFPGVPTGSGDKGVMKKLIRDSNHARELADLEATRGVNVTLAREKELKRISEGGLSDVEEKFVAIMKGMAEKYPDAFDRQIDGKGREFLQLRVDSGGTVADYFTQYGLLHVDLKPGNRGLGTEDVVELAGFASGIKGGELPRGIFDSGKIDRWAMVNLADPETQKYIKETSIAVQTSEEAAKAALKGGARDAESILANL